MTEVGGGLWEVLRAQTLSQPVGPVTLPGPYVSKCVSVGGMCLCLRPSSGRAPLHAPFLLTNGAI